MVQGDIPERPVLVDDLPHREALRPSLARLADHIANVVDSAPLTCPILITGDWGSGKTSLLHAVCDRLGAEGRMKGAVPTVVFEAWHYESASSLLPALMRRVWDATPKRFRAGKKATALLCELLHWAAAVATRMISPVALGELDKQLDLEKAALGLDKALAGVAPRPEPLDALRDAFAALVHGAWDGRSPVVFVDDLDRCNPSDAVMLLDAIRALAVCAHRLNTRFVVAIDRPVVTQAISAKFANIRGYDGNRYLEKIFPLEFCVPHPAKDEIRNVIERLAAPLEDGERARTVFALTEALDRPYFANTRLIKRCFNRYRLLRFFEQHGPAKGDADKLSLQWIAATERWPRLRALQQRRQPEFWPQTARRGASDDPDLQLLLAEPGFTQWLATHNWPNAADALDRYDDADQRLRRFGM